jgi:hypothetical protein
MIVRDASRSMWAKIGVTSKVGLVRISLGQALGDYQDKVAFGLVAFGHRPASACGDNQVLAKSGELTPKTQSTLLFGFKPQSNKPIAASLTAAAEAAQSKTGALDIVLITDGSDSCKADICTTAQALKQTSPGLRIHVLAFAAKTSDDAKSLDCIAEASGGQFIAATNAEELKRGLASLLDTVGHPPPAPAPPAAPVGAVADVPPKAQSGDAQVGPPQAVPPAPGQVQPEPTASGPPSTEPAPAKPTAAATSQSEMQKSEAPPQTEVTKSAAPAPGQTEIAAQAPHPAPLEPAMPVPVTFKALLTEVGPKVESGLIWRVFASAAGADGKHKLVSTHREAMPTAALLPGDYLVNAAFGLSNLTKKIKVQSGRSLEETFVLNTGALRLEGVLANGEPLPAEIVHFDILSDEEDQFGNRHTILGDAKPGAVIRLNAGAYHILSRYGDANATVRADVTIEPGKLTDATLKHVASKVTFKLVQGLGGEAQADTQWSILTKTGDVVKENVGALPTCILAPGAYAVVARHADASYTRTFDVGASEAKQIEVVMDDGPATPEALRAVTNPTPAPAPADDEAVASPVAPNEGLGFGNQPPASGGGLLSNPGALLHPRTQ